MKTTFYSLNEEDFDHPSDILDELDEDGRLSPGQTYWECDFKPMDLDHLAKTQSKHLLEIITECVYIKLGEECADAVAGQLAHKDESLAAVLAAGLKEHLTEVPWEPTGKSRECTLTQEQIDAHNSPQPATVEAGEAVPVPDPIWLIKTYGMDYVRSRVFEMRRGTLDLDALGRGLCQDPSDPRRQRIRAGIRWLAETPDVQWENFGGPTKGAL